MEETVIKRRQKRVGVGGIETVRKRTLDSIATHRPQDSFAMAFKNYHETLTKSLSSGANQRPDDAQETFSGGGAAFGAGIINAPYNLYALSKLPNNNSILKQCIDVMVTNIHSNGHRLEYIGPKGEEESKEAQAEKNNLTNFLENPNGDYSMIEMRERLGADYETFGNAYIEVLRDRSGKIVGVYHIPAYTMRLTNYDRNITTSTARVLGVDGKYYTKTYKKRFRRFAQYLNGQYVYFKEFGDPRALNPRTGEFGEVSFDQSATEIFHFAEYSIGSPYGMPRWFNQLPAIMGSREAELTNLDYFQENAVPAMAIMVAGGFLTDETMTAIESAFTNIRGRSAQNRVVVIEAAGDVEASDEHGRLPAPKLELKPLHEDRQGDALFQNYEKNCSDKIRSSFRIPPIFLGMSSDYNRATADRSLILGESQIFAPERRKFDDFMNIKVLSNFEPRFWKFKSLAPKIAGAEDIAVTVKTLSTAGAITPNAAINLSNEMLDLDIKPIQEEWGNRPFFLTQAQAQHGLFGDIGIGTNIETPAASGGISDGPTQQRTPARGGKTPIKKRLKLTDLLPDDDNEGDDTVSPEGNDGASD